MTGIYKKIGNLHQPIAAAKNYSTNKELKKKPEILLASFLYFFGFFAQAEFCEKMKISQKSQNRLFLCSAF